MKSTRRIIKLGCVALLLMLGALVLYSYQRLLVFERRFMPEIATLPTRHERRVSFHFIALWSATWIPHWTVTYHEQPLTDTEYIDPAITVDLFGRIVDVASKEVFSAVETYKREYQ
jgi:hypothetical protein